MIDTKEVEAIRFDICGSVGSVPYSTAGYQKRTTLPRSATKREGESAKKEVGCTGRIEPL